MRWEREKSDGRFEREIRNGELKIGRSVGSRKRSGAGLNWTAAALELGWNQWAPLAVNQPTVTAHDVVQLCCCGLCDVVNRDSKI
jgi:hypothetical protein